MSEWLLFALIFYAGGVTGSIPVSIMTIARIETLKPSGRTPTTVSEVVAASILASICWPWLAFQILTPSNWKKA